MSNNRLNPDSFDSAWKSFSELNDSALRDPMVTKIIDDAREVFDACKVGLSDETGNVRYLIEELDKTWGFFMGNVMRVTGYVSVANVPKERGDAFEVIAEAHFAEDQEVVLHGFHVSVDEEGERELRVCGLSAAVNENGVPGSLFWDIPLEADLTFPRASSAEHALAYLESNIPDALADIEEKVLGVDGGDSAARILSLSDIDYGELLKYEGEEETRTALFLTSYLNGIMDTDKTLPYFISYEGTAIVDEGVGLCSVEEALFRIDEFVLIKLQLEGCSEWAMFARGLMATPDDREDFEVKLRIDEMVSLESLRSQYYS